MSILSNLLRVRAGASGLIPKVVEVVDSTARLALLSSEVNVGDIVREVGQETIITIECVGDVSGSLQWQAIAINGIEYYLADGGDIQIEEDASAVDVATALTAFLVGLGLSADRDGDFITIMGGDSLTITDPYASLGFDITEVQAGIAPGSTFVALDLASLSTEEGWQKYSGSTPIIIRTGFLDGDGDTSYTLSAGTWTKIIFDDIISGAEYIDLENGLMTPPKGYGVVSIYGDVHQHASSYFRCLGAVWANGQEYDPQSARLFDHAVLPTSVVSGTGNAAESSAMMFSLDGTTTFEMRMWRGVAGALKKYYNSGTRMVILWFPS